MNTLRFSVLMAVYNAEKYLAQALDSVIAQSCQEWELICVDDASSDQSASILKEYAAKDSRIKVFLMGENRGQAVQRNYALGHATGEFVFALDADDWLGTDAMELMLEEFRYDDSVDCVVMRLCNYWQETGLQDMYPEIEQRALSGKEAFRLSFDWTLHGIYAIKRAIFEKYPFDTTYRLYSDDNTTRMHYLNSRIVRMSSAVYFYRRHAESCTQAVSLNRFLYMKANLRMKEMLMEAGVEDEMLQLYERQRWLNYIGQMHLLYKNQKRFTKLERNKVENDFREIYQTFNGSKRMLKFGYFRFNSYRIFLCQEYLYFRLKDILNSCAK